DDRTRGFGLARFHGGPDLTASSPAFVGASEGDPVLTQAGANSDANYLPQGNNVSRGKCADYHPVRKNADRVGQTVRDQRLSGLPLENLFVSVLCEQTANETSSLVSWHRLPSPTATRRVYENRHSPASC